MKKQLRIARVVTIPFTFSMLLSCQITEIEKAGIGITLVSSDETELSILAQKIGVTHHSIQMARQPALFQDLKSLWYLYKFFRRERFDIVHSSTPKAGLLTAIAGKAAFVPIRLHTFTGQRWATMSGFSRFILRTFDRLVGSLCTRTYADSLSQRTFLIDSGIVKSEKIHVLGSGSISGVDLERFSAEKWGGSQGLQTRSQLGIPQESIVITFVGRVTKDKGISELVEAFTRISDLHSNVYLVILGPTESDLDPIPSKTSKLIETNNRILTTGFCTTPEKYLGAADIFCLPSYREGFGTVIVEAGAMGLPAVATAVTGLVDAIIDGKTGILVPPMDVESLASALITLIEKPELRQQLGAAAKDRTNKEFKDDYVNKLVVDEYYRLARQLDS